MPSGSGSWSSLSDRNAKEGIKPLEGREVLEKLSRLPMHTWKYKDQAEGIRHAGPMAQDFYAAFGLGEDERHISTAASDGIALSAIQGLKAEKDEEIAAHQTQLQTLYEDNKALHQDNRDLKARMAKMEVQMRELMGRFQATQ